MSTFDEVIQNQDKFWFCCRCRADRLSRIFAIISLCFSAIFIVLTVLMLFLLVGAGIAAEVAEEGKAGKGNHATTTMMTPVLGKSGGSTNASGGGNLVSWLINIIANVLILIGYSKRKSGYYIPALVLEGVVLAILGIILVFSLITVIGFIFFLPFFLLAFFFFWVDFRAYQLIKLEEEWRQNHGPQSVGYAPNSYAVTMPPPADAQYYAPQNYPPPAKY